jgi:hypothetical protein
MSVIGIFALLHLELEIAAEMHLWARHTNWNASDVLLA